MLSNILAGTSLQVKVRRTGANDRAMLHLTSAERPPPLLPSMCILWGLRFLRRVQEVIDANILPALVERMRDSTFKTRKEACWALSNATVAGTPEQIK